MHRCQATDLSFAYSGKCVHRSVTTMTSDEQDGRLKLMNSISMWHDVLQFVTTVSWHGFGAKRVGLSGNTSRQLDWAGVRRSVDAGFEQLVRHSKNINKRSSGLYTWSSISVMEDEACHKHVVLRYEWWPRCERATEEKHKLAFHAAISGRPRKKQWHRKVRLCCHFVRVIRYYFCSSVTGSV